ncbi:hypothetical protein Q4603_02880 [Zobellia galactanivorans]|uniref:hypothetical protein n=1 Tax=Zobellia galactanivorans (strain DSM 12802 / CCUG 47099 / CIP 106680 / NCIMB 13871 / Dsij) TaxID=63186 RepID=UPI0026E37F13|nr:hypothetical protein [Zobellia galactanivorans]MDO6807532.1 hypothetical protein [Zobellia galactanivorans]
MTLLTYTTSLYTKSTFNFSLNSSHNILILGNSHPECAINDSLIPKTKNLAQSGAAYFYDYLKLKNITKHNKQIDTVILGYSYSILQKDMDAWLDAESKINTQIRYYFFLLDFKDYWTLLSANPIATLKSTPQTIFHNIRMKSKGYSYLGGYKSLSERKLKQAKKYIKPLDIDKTHEYSQYQIKYLIEIYKFCESNNISLILLNTPVHPIIEELHEPLKKGYYDFAKNQLPNATLMDHSSFDLPESAYRDLSHLHKTGAEIYSNYLKELLNSNK